MSAFFYYQDKAKEEVWKPEVASGKGAFLHARKPLFHTVLDVAGAGTGGSDVDWAKVRYFGPFYADLDDDEGDVDYVCTQFKKLLGKLTALGVSLDQVKLYATGGRGFHIEIPSAVMMTRVPSGGTAWLPYIYRKVSEKIHVETLDTNVYTGRRGRMWRTPDVLRDNGKYKVRLTTEQALTIDPDTYAELCSHPQPDHPPAASTLCSALAVIYEEAKDATQAAMRNKKKRSAEAVKILQPFRAKGEHPETILKLMRGEHIREGVGFQAIAMQLAVYATTVGIERAKFLEMCDGLVNNHIGDGYRYRSTEKRLTELGRMYDYMEVNALYDFEVGPLVALMGPAHVATEFGQVPQEVLNREGEAVPATEADRVRSLQHTRDGVYSEDEHGEMHLVLGASFARVRKLVPTKDHAPTRHDETLDKDVPLPVTEDQETLESFTGYQLDLRRGSQKYLMSLTSGDFNSAKALRSAFNRFEVPTYINDLQAQDLLAMLKAKSERSPTIHTIHREGLSIIPHPDDPDTLVPVFVTEAAYSTPYGSSSGPVPGMEDKHFEVRLSRLPGADFKLDMLNASRWPLVPTKAFLTDLLTFNHPRVVGLMLGWYLACYLKPWYMVQPVKQFPILHPFGTAGSGKSQTCRMLGSLHWANMSNVAETAAPAPTPLVLQAWASGSGSAPILLDEYKIPDLDQARRLSAMRSVLRSAYGGGVVGDRGAVVSNKITRMQHISATPIVIAAEALETETAVLERTLHVPLSATHTPQHKASFKRLETTQVRRDITALGYAYLTRAASMGAEEFAAGSLRAQEEIDRYCDERLGGRMAPRPRANIAVVLHAWDDFWAYLDGTCPGVVPHEHVKRCRDGITDVVAAYDLVQSSMTPEVAKVLRSLARMTTANKASGLTKGTDYLVLGDSVHLSVEDAYEKYARNCMSIYTRPLFSAASQFHTALKQLSCFERDDLGDESPLGLDDPNAMIVSLNAAGVRSLGGGTFKE